MGIKEVFPNSYRYQPLRDRDFKVIETKSNYINRMKGNVLPNWPKELLEEWLYRHAIDIEKYTFLNFRKFVFEKEIWHLKDIPKKEVYHDPLFFENFKNIKTRANHDSNDWLAHYMLENGTWNTPIVLLKSPKGNINFLHGESLRSPFHLLEGHRRLAFLNGLKELNLAKERHELWITSKKS